MWGWDDEEDERPIPPLPGHKVHNCTDVLCLLLFLGCLGHLSQPLQYAWARGNIKRLTHGVDYQGRLCGTENLGHYTYWCLNSTNALDLGHPTCVETCPSDNSTFTECFDASTGLTVATADYPTRFFMLACLPRNKQLMDQAQDAIFGTSIDDQVLAALQEVWRAWLPLAISAAFSIVVGFLYLALLGSCAFCLVILCLVAMSVAPIGIGAYFIYVSQIGGSDGIPETDDNNGDLLCGIALIVGGALVGLVASCGCDNLRQAAGCIEASCECIFQIPSLLLEPFIALTVKVVLFVPLVYGFGLLLSVEETDDWGTISRLYVVEYVLMMLWLLELTHALSQYALCFATQLWYFTPYSNGRKQGVPSFTICQGYCNAFTFHLGSLALSSFLFVWLRWVRTIMRVLTSAARRPGNPLGACLSQCCFFCVECYHSGLEFLDKKAYMDMAMTSSSFCVAAEHAMDIVATEVPAVAVLNGAQLVFQLAGIGITSLASGVLSLIIVERVQPFNNPEKMFFVADPKPVAIAAGVLGCFFAINFMFVFDMVGDTILYCFAVDQRRFSHISRGEKTEGGIFGWLFGSAEDEMDPERALSYAPPRLRNLIAEQHAEMS